jgi:hypothetical protein
VLLIVDLSQNAYEYSGCVSSLIQQNHDNNSFKDHDLTVVGIIGHPVVGLVSRK